MLKINKEAQEVINRLSRASETYGTIFDSEKIVVAMQKHYVALGVPMPKVVSIYNMEEAYSAAWGAAWDAARGAARDAAWGADPGVLWVHEG